MKKRFYLFGKYLIFVLLLFNFSFIDPNLLKKISDKEFKYEFCTSNKKIKVLKGTTYYWFKGGAIHVSEYGMSGEILNGIFMKYYLDNQLAEKGHFKYGKKIGEWKSWHKNGQIQILTRWRNGKQNGSYIKFADNGKLLESGKFKNGRKEGIWIDYLKKDTLKYKKGEVFLKKKEILKEAKKNQNSSKKELKNQEKTNKNKKKVKKEHWWLKYFKKKNDKS